jgi:hypothetical protein
MHQVTIRASLTQDTPCTIAALLTDPRTDHDTWHHAASPAADYTRAGESFHSRDEAPQSHVPTVKTAAG